MRVTREEFNDNQPHLILCYGGYQGYFVNRNGDIMNRTKRLKPWISKHGYALVDLSVDGKVSHKSVHRIVALTFLANPQNKPEVNHKDGNKLNNHVDNLEWATKSENIAHSFGVLKNKHPKAKPVRCIETDEVYPSASEAARFYGTNTSNVCAVIKGRRKLAGGHTWEFYDG